MLAMFILYRPVTFFLICSIPFWLISCGIGIRALTLAWSTSGGLVRDHLPSLLLLVISATIAIMFDALALIGDLLRAQRRLTEEVLYQIRKQNMK